MVSACAQRPVLIHCQVPNFSGRAGGASIDLLIDDQSCSDAASNLDEREVFSPRPAS
jgi:hypothetical protein